MNLQGIWKGFYQYNNKRLPESYSTSITGFTIEIKSFDGKNFEGTVFDDLESGGTRGIGTITGKIKNNKISFVKKMPVSTIVYPDGTVVEEDKPHRNIYYQGILEHKVFKGTWRFKFGISFRGGIFLYPASKGTWQMEKTDENPLFSFTEN